MIVRYLVYYSFSVLILVESGYSPPGDEVQAGSVLLPATRRGRYLANIVRRQAVDGTGIKFNKDADRMNAEAKKKVDVLSEELLPYIIAEQERRTTLYKRVMTAIQNGEKGVTIAEIRNKPPLIIRKGLMYRCPANRAPREPDGSGVLMCETDIEPTPVMYDSCLSAEDKELYVAENKYFFCNRHKVEGPDLPRNGSTVIGCAPLERTSLNYTSGRCALEDTDDVVVHYRYYPDKTYKFVTELDPDHEVCDHWNPCQIGYIYSLPSPDQAMPANELWHDYEIVPPIPEDSPDEYVSDDARADYKTSPRKIDIPPGYKFNGIGRLSLQNIRTRVTLLDNVLKNYTNIRVKVDPPPPKAPSRRRSSKRKFSGRRDETGSEEQGSTGSEEKGGTGTEGKTGNEPEGTSGGGTEGKNGNGSEGKPGSGSEGKPGSGSEGKGASGSEGTDGSGSASDASSSQSSSDGGSPGATITIQLFFSPLLAEDLTHYYARFESLTKRGSYKYRTIVNLHRASVETQAQELNLLPGQFMNTTKIPMKCGKCTLKSLMVRALDNTVTNLDRSRFKVRSEIDSDGKELKFVEIDVGKTQFTDFGDYFFVVQTEEGNTERVKCFTLQSGDIVVHSMSQSVSVGIHIDNTVKYECEGCVCEDVICNGESVLPTGRVSIVTASKFINFNFPSFEDENSCIYTGLFKDQEGKTYQRTLQIIENDAVNVEKKVVTSLPAPGTKLEYTAPFKCDGQCTVNKVTLNGALIPAMTRRSGLMDFVFYTFTPESITITITSFSLFYCGIYQAQFMTSMGSVTKSILELRRPGDTAVTETVPESTPEGEPVTTEGATTAGGTSAGATEAAPEGEAPAEPEGEAPAEPEGEAPAEPEGEAPAEPEGEPEPAPEDEARARRGG